MTEQAQTALLRREVVTLRWAGLTQRQIADRLHITRQYVGKLLPAELRPRQPAPLTFDEMQELRVLAVLTASERNYVYRVPTGWAGLIARRLVKRGLAERAPFGADDPVYRRDMYRASAAGLRVLENGR